MRRIPRQRAASATAPRPTGTARPSSPRLLVVTLASVIVSALFYRESVAVRSIENRLALSQTRWVERAALDWAKVILRSDPATYDHGTDVWGTPVVETQLDETVTGGAKIGDSARNAFLAGSVTDAQAKFNVNTLVGANGEPSVAAHGGDDQADDAARTAGVAGPAGAGADPQVAHPHRSTTIACRPPRSA